MDIGVLLDIVILLYIMNVGIYISMDRGGNNKLITQIEEWGIPRQKFILLFQNMMFFGSFVMILASIINIFT